MNLEQRIAQAEEKKKKAVAAIIKLRSQANKKERAADTRRKILIGSMMLAEMHKNPEFERSIKQRLASYLDKDLDRALFGL